MALGRPPLPGIRLACLIVFALAFGSTFGLSFGLASAVPIVCVLTIGWGFVLKKVAVFQLCVVDVACFCSVLPFTLHPSSSLLERHLYRMFPTASNAVLYYCLSVVGCAIFPTYTVPSLFPPGPLRAMYPRSLYRLYAYSCSLRPV